MQTERQQCTRVEVYEHTCIHCTFTCTYLNYFSWLTFNCEAARSLLATVIVTSQTVNTCIVYCNFPDKQHKQQICVGTRQTSREAFQFGFSLRNPAHWYLAAQMQSSRVGKNSREIIHSAVRQMTQRWHKNLPDKPMMSVQVEVVIGDKYRRNKLFKCPLWAAVYSNQTKNSASPTWRWHWQIKLQLANWRKSK